MTAKLEIRNMTRAKVDELVVSWAQWKAGTPACMTPTRSGPQTRTPSSPQKWTARCLAGIGINFPQHRARALEIGEQLGIYRDYPVPKGCTSPFAPIWINEMVSRQGSIDGQN